MIQYLEASISNNRRFKTRLVNFTFVLVDCQMIEENHKIKHIK